MGFNCSWIRIAILGFSLALGPSSWAIAKAGGSSPYTTVTNFGALLKDHVLPEVYQCAYSRLNSAVEPNSYSNSTDVGNINQGFNGFYKQQVAANSCFAKKAGRFWEDAIALGDRQAPLAKNSIDSSGDLHAPTLEEKTGEGRFQKLKAGWLWDAALHAAHGDQNLATSLIGMCTNDQMAVFYYDESSPNPLVRCPYSGTAIFAEGALSPSLALPDSMRQHALAMLHRRLDERQEYPSSPFAQEDAVTLSAKTYHYTAGMVVGCELKKCGVSANQIRVIAKNLARAYRATTLCTKIKERLADADALTNDLGVSLDRPDSGRLIVDRFLKEGWCADPVHPMLHGSKYLSNCKEQGPEAVRKSAEYWLKEVDAAKLYRKLFLHDGNLNWSCSNIQISGFPLLSRDASHGLGKYASECRISGWSQERCTQARQAVADWMFDFEWTEFQQSAGAEFGSSRCYPEPLQGDSLHDRSLGETCSLNDTKSNWHDGDDHVESSETSAK